MGASRGFRVGAPENFPVGVSKEIVGIAAGEVGV